ncbi:MAG TPA: SoxR reducing system RseC family protein, partial [Gemmatimonadaceae bacterium]
TLGIAAGLAVATKDSAAGLFVAVPLATFAMPRPSGTPFPWRPWSLVLVAGFLALGIGSGLFIDPANYLNHLMFLMGRVESLPGTETFSLALPMTAAGHLAALRFQIEGTADILTLAGLVLALAGAGWFVPRSRRAALLLLPALTYSVFVFFLLRAEAIRYLLPLGFVLALFAGAAVDGALHHSNRLVRGGVALLFVVAVGIGLLRAIDLTHAMIRDSRYDAARWLATRLAAGDRVEYFGASQKLPELPRGVVIERATPYYGMHTVHDTSVARTAAIIDAWAQRRPTLIIVIPDHSTLRRGSPYDGSVPPSLFRALEAGELPYRRVARFETPPMLPWIRRRPLDYPMVNPPVHLYAAEPLTPR